MIRTISLLIGLIGISLLPSPASPQLLPPVRTLPGTLPDLPIVPSDRVAGTTAEVTATLESNLDLQRRTEGLTSSALARLRLDRLRELVRRNSDVLDLDARGNPVRRNEILAVDLSEDDSTRLVQAGYRLLRRESLGDLGLTTTVWAPPQNTPARRLLRDLSSIAPGAGFELNHVYEPAGAALQPVSASGVGGAPNMTGAIGMVDGGVAPHPSLNGAAINQRSFSSLKPVGSGHGTAVASLLVGKDRAFRGAAAGRSLMAADVYGGSPASGSAEAIARSLNWLAAARVSVINISLVGPPNEVLRRAVSATLSRGIPIVAAVGNDGPAAPLSYPASWPGVVAVTGVDARLRALPEAGRSAHLDFAAPGAEMAAARPGDGYTVVRGTSFAAPLVAARLASARSIDELAKEAVPGTGKIGRGIVCASCRVVPADVLAKK